MDLGIIIWNFHMAFLSRPIIFPCAVFIWLKVILALKKKNELGGFPLYFKNVYRTLIFFP